MTVISQILYGFLLMLVTITTQASIITFDDITTASFDTIPAGYNGFDWVGYDPLNDTVGGNVHVSTGSNATVSGAYAVVSTGFQFSRTGNGLFNVNDFYAAYDSVLYSDITVSGFKNGALTFQTNIFFDTTSTLISLGFTGIDLLRVESGSIDTFSVDDISLTAVPLPAAVWLFGSGLLALAGVARRDEHTGDATVAT